MGRWRRWVTPLLATLVALTTVVGGTPGPAAAATCVVTSPGDSGAGTLREHLGNAACDVITFQAGLGTITILNALPIARGVTVQGPGASALTVQYGGAAQPDGSVFRISAGPVMLSGLTVRGGRALGYAGGLHIAGTPGPAAVTLESLVITDNIGYSTGGGGIYASNATLAMHALQVTGNTAQNNSYQFSWGGGGIFLYGFAGPVAATLTGSTISGNAAPNNNGGGIEIYSWATDAATLTASDTTVSNNTNGGLVNDKGTATLTNVVIDGNTGLTGFVNDAGLATLTNVVVSNHPVSGLYNTGTLIMTNGAITGNASGEHGGGFVNNSGGTATLTGTTVSGNTAFEDGGGIKNNGTLTVTGSTLINNESGNYGGAIHNDNGDLTVINSTVSGNSGSSGGGLANNFGTLTMLNATVVGNSAYDGAGLFSFGNDANPASTTVRQSIILGNGDEDCDTISTTYAPLISQGHNVVGVGGACPTNGGGDIGHTGALAAVVDPTLADNGGPTKTHALVPSSPAVNLVPAAQCVAPADQRGVARPQGLACDSGAVEAVPTQVALTLAVQGPGTVERGPAGDGNGPFVYSQGTLVTLTPQADAGNSFIGWTVDGTFQGWANPLTVSMNGDHDVVATFAPPVPFGDVGGDHSAAGAIAALAARGIIQGYGDGTFGPDDTALRTQMAALIARALGYGDSPANPFTDRCDPLNPGNCVDDELWNRVAQLADREIARGYTDPATCAPAAVPCYAPRDFVLHVQVLSFIARTMVDAGYWQQQPNDPAFYGGVLNGSGHEQDVTTFVFYTQAVGGVPDYPVGGGFPLWDQPVTRGWFARALWAALDSYFSLDRVP